MSRTPNHQDGGGKTPTEENARNPRAERHSESLKVSSVQDYTSGEGHEQEEEELHEGEGEEYGLPGGGAGEVPMGD